MCVCVSESEREREREREREGERIALHQNRCALIRKVHNHSTQQQELTCSPVEESANVPPQKCLLEKVQGKLVSIRNPFDDDAICLLALRSAYDLLGTHSRHGCR